MATASASPKGGVIWSTVNGGAMVLLPFAVFALFARMMTPAELSLVMLAVAMLELLKAFGPQGLYDVLLVHDEDERRYYRTAGTLLLGGGVVIALVYMGGLALSPWILSRQLPPVLLLLAFKVLLDYALLQPQAVLVRRGALRRLGTRGLAAGVIAGAAGLLVAMATSPIVGLTSYYVTQSLVAFLMMSWRSDALRRPGWDSAAAREMANQGSRASGVRLSAAVSNYLDQLLVGSMLTGAQTGAYNLGKRLEVVAITIGSSFSQILFQRAFVKAERDERVGHIARGMAAITLVCGVPAVLLAVFHREIVPLLFGAQWLGAALTVALLTGSGFFRAIGGVAGALYTVTGRNGRLLALSAFAAATNILMIAVFARFGVAAAAGAVLVRNALQSVAMVALAEETKGHVARLFARECILPLLAAGAAAWTAGAAIALLLPQGFPAAYLLPALGGCLIGSAAGFALLHRRL